MEKDPDVDGDADLFYQGRRTELRRNANISLDI